MNINKRHLYGNRNNTSNNNQTSINSGSSDIINISDDPQTSLCGSLKASIIKTSCVQNTKQNLIQNDNNYILECIENYDNNNDVVYKRKNKNDQKNKTKKSIKYIKSLNLLKNRIRISNSKTSTSKDILIKNKKHTKFHIKKHFWNP